MTQRDLINSIAKQRGIFVGCDTCACFFCERNLCDFGCQQCDGRPSIFCSELSEDKITEAQP